MKTFDEALKGVFRKTDSRSGAEVGEELERDAAPFLDTMQEIIASPDVHEMAATFQALVIAGTMDPHAAIMNAFLAGVRVGMEMERNPLEVLT